MSSFMEKILDLWKKYQWELIIFLIVSAVGLLSFGLGYTMAKDSTRTPIIIEKNSG